MTGAITSQLVIDFWSYMQQEYGSRQILKSDSYLMKLVAESLNLMGIQDQETFLEHFTTTFHRSIYTPFQIGTVSPTCNLWDQILICVHEHQHIEQGDRDGWLKFDVTYASSRTCRATYEVEAYGCQLELNYWRYGKQYDLRASASRYAAGLRNYGCGTTEIMMADQMFLVRLNLIEQGAVENRSTIRAIDWLSEHAAIV